MHFQNLNASSQSRRLNCRTLPLNTPLTHPGLGRNALLPPPQRRASHVPPLLQRRLLVTQDLVRNRLPDPQCLVLRHGLRPGALALPRLLLDGAMLLPRPARHAPAVRPEQGLVPPAGVVRGERELEGRRGGGEDYVHGGGGAAHAAVEACVYDGDDGAEYAAAGGVVLLHVALQSPGPADMGDGDVHRAGVRGGYVRRVNVVVGGPEGEEDRGSGDKG